MTFVVDLLVSLNKRKKIRGDIGYTWTDEWEVQYGRDRRTPEDARITSGVFDVGGGVNTRDGSPSQDSRPLGLPVPITEVPNLNRRWV